MPPGPARAARPVLWALVLGAAAGLAPAARAACRACAPAHWERLALGQSPPAGLDVSLCADPERGLVHLFGGRGAEGFLGGLWSLDLAARTWRAVEGRGPSPRSGASLVVEPGTGRLLLFGGYQTDGSGRLQLLNDLWIHAAGEGWRREYLPSPPPPRAWHAALVAEGRMLVFGGFSRAAGPAGAYLQDLWSLSLAEPAWRRAATDGGPRMAGRPVLTRAPAGGQLGVFGRDGVPIPAAAGFYGLALEDDRWEAPAPLPGLPLDFGTASPSADGGRVVLLRGPSFLEPGWWIGSATPGRACCSHPAANPGPEGGEGMVCVAEPGRRDAWVCFGGAREKDLSDATWRLVVPAEGGGP